MTELIQEQIKSEKLVYMNKRIYLKKPEGVSPAGSLSVAEFTKRMKKLDPTFVYYPSDGFYGGMYRRGSSMDFVKKKKVRDMKHVGGTVSKLKFPTFPAEDFYCTDNLDADGMMQPMRGWMSSVRVYCKKRNIPIRKARSVFPRLRWL